MIFDGIAAEDPIVWMHEALAHPRVEVWRWASAQDHQQWRDLRDYDGKVKVKVSYDGRLDCDDCRPYAVYQERIRLLEAFTGREMYVAVIRGADRTEVRAKHLDTVSWLQFALRPVATGHHAAVLTTRPMRDMPHLLVEEHDEFLNSLLLPLRWEGVGFKASATRNGFMKPKRQPRAWEACHPFGPRSCGHEHEAREEAEACLVVVAMRCDGTTEGWRVQRRDLGRALGRIRGDLDNVGVASILGQCGLNPEFPWWAVSPEKKAIAPIEFEAEWIDPRFVMARELLNWRPPPGKGETWTPAVASVRYVVGHGGMAIS